LGRLKQQNPPPITATVRCGKSSDTQSLQLAAQDTVTTDRRRRHRAKLICFCHPPPANISTVPVGDTHSVNTTLPMTNKSSSNSSKLHRTNRRSIDHRDHFIFQCSIRQRQRGTHFFRERREAAATKELAAAQREDRDATKTRRTAGNAERQKGTEKEKQAQHANKYKSHCR